MASYIISGILYEKIGAKPSMMVAYGISTLGGIFLLAWGLQNQQSAAFLVCFLLAKFGVAATFNINYAANSYFFPTLFQATALGICQVSGRFFTAWSFQTSEI